MSRQKKTVNVSVPQQPNRDWLIVRGARQHNLKDIDVPFPLGTFCAVTGVSGSGKSSLVNDILFNTLAKLLHRAQSSPGACNRIDGIEHLNKVIRVDQQPLGQTPTSNPATYTGAFELIRMLFAQLPESKLRGFSQRRFSFNVPGGRCEKCEGAGQLKVEMHFLPDVWITCDSCNGKRYDGQTLEIKYHGHSIADVLEMSCGEALALFKNIPPICRILQTLCDVGLDYLALGQAAPTLSGGEAQRVKLAAELARPDTGRTLYLLDEPTTGLHFDDLQKLLDVLHRLVDLGNTVIVIEHNLDVIKNADWIVDLGPEAGNEGGYIVFAGTPEDLTASLKIEPVKPVKRQTASKKTKKAAPSDAIATPTNLPPGFASYTPLQYRSYTAEALTPVLEAGPYIDRKSFRFSAHQAAPDGDLSIEELGVDTKMPWEIDGCRWHTRDRVSRSGHPIRWNGEILRRIVEQIEQSELFAPTNWNNRSIVEIRAEKKSLGWFFHALTSEEWLLKMKFRTAQNTFRKDAIIQLLDLKPLNDVDEVPLYGTEPRVRVRRLPGPWQEIELRVYSLHEIDRPEFWRFIESAVNGFGKFTEKMQRKPDELMPWKILGEKWHFLPKGLVGGEKLLWDVSLLHKIFGIIRSVAPQARFVWSNKVLVPVYREGATRQKIDGRNVPWVVVHTKKVDAVHIDLYAPKYLISQGRIRALGIHPHVHGENDGYDIVRLRFQSEKDIKADEFRALLEMALPLIPESPRQ